MSNRHICIPELTLKKFNNDGKNNEPLCYYDIQHKNICKSSHTCFLTQQDYYSQNVDKKFSDMIETKMGSIYARIEIALGKKEILPKTIINLQETTEKIIAIQSLRNPDYTRKYTLLHFTRLSLKGRKGARKLANIIFENDDYFEEYLNIYYVANCLKTYRSMILFNATDRDFFLPTTHFYIVPYLAGYGSNLFVIIMSPKIAWILMKADDYKRNINDKNGEIIPRLTSPKEVVIMNYLAYRFESKYGTGKIVSTQEELNQFNLNSYNEFIRLVENEHSELFIETNDSQ